jgi:hypothetical protein
MPYPRYLTLQSSSEFATASPVISLPLNTNSLNALFPDSNAEAAAELSPLPLPGGGPWETAAHAYSREEEFHSLGMRAPPKGHLPPTEARELKLSGGAKAMSDSTPRDAFASSGQMSLEASPNPKEAALFSRIAREGRLQPPAPMYDNDLERKMAEAFRPEIIHLGHVTVSSPIITAIARRNPLCLLDSIILRIEF